MADNSDPPASHRIEIAIENMNQPTNEVSDRGEYSRLIYLSYHAS